MLVKCNEYPNGEPNLDIKTMLQKLSASFTKFVVDQQLFHVVILSYGNVAHCFNYFFFFFFCGRSAVPKPPVHMLPGIRWRGAGLPPFSTACWRLTHPAAITGASVAARGKVLEDVVDRLFCFFAITECRVHDASSL